MGMKSRDGDKTLVKRRDYIAEQNSITEAVIGQLVEWKDSTGVGAPTFIRPIIAQDSLEGVCVEMQNEYSEKAIMSFDGLIRPISMDGSGGLPRYIRFTSGTYNNIKQDDLNPFTNPSGNARDHLARTRSDTDDIGHDIEVLARTGDVEGTPKYGLIMPPSRSGIPPFASGQPELPDYKADYRAMALRGPLLLAGWGYDVCGYPVPNKQDSLAALQSGTFETDYSVLDETKFFDNHLRRSDTWAVAPVDLRLDKHRGIWTSGDRIIKAIADAEIGPDSSGPVTPQYNGNGGATITAYTNWIHGNVNIAEGSELLIYYFADEQKYVVIKSECPADAAPPPATNYWTPEDLSGVVFWASSLHIDDLVNGQGLTTWEDFSPYLRNITTLPTMAPIYQTLALSAEFPGLYFLPNTVIQLPSGVADNLNSTGEVTMFLLSKTINTGTDEVAYWDTVSDEFSMFASPNTSRITYLNNGSVNDTPDASDVYLQNFPQMIGVVSDGTGVQYWNNGTHGGTTYNSGSSFTEDLYIGRPAGSHSGVPISGWVFELLVVDQAVSTDDRQKIEGYIAHKFTVNDMLPSGHPYKDEAPAI